MLMRKAIALRTSHRSCEQVVLGGVQQQPVLGSPHLQPRSSAMPRALGLRQHGRQQRAAGLAEPPLSSLPGVQPCQRGWGWTEVCWFPNSIIPLGQSRPAAAESPPHQGVHGCGWSLCSLLLPLAPGSSLGVLGKIPMVRRKRSPCLGRKCFTDGFGAVNHPGRR